MAYYVRRQWFVEGEKTEHGPMTEDALQAFLRQHPKEEWQYREEGLDVWFPAAQLLVNSPEATSASPAEPPMPPDGARREMTTASALILLRAFFLPWVQAGCGSMRGFDLLRLDQDLYLPLGTAAAALGAALMARDFDAWGPRLVAGVPALASLALLLSKAGRMPQNLTLEVLRSGAIAALVGTVGIAVATFVYDLRDFASRRGVVAGIVLVVAVGAAGAWGKYGVAQCTERCDADCVQEAARLNPFPGGGRNELGEAACLARVRVCREQCAAR